jgi:hypothetical protein
MPAFTTTTGRRSILAAVVTAPVLALATAAALPVHSHAATVCGATAKDLVGTFVDEQAFSGGKGVSTVTFKAPNAVTTDHEATTAAGQPVMSLKGTGTFTVGPPLGWTEQGTYHVDDGTPQGRTGPYQLQFKASAESCTDGSQVSTFTGTYSSGGTQGSQPDTFTRKS